MFNLDKIRPIEKFISVAFQWYITWPYSFKVIYYNWAEKVSAVKILQWSSLC